MKIDQAELENIEGVYRYENFSKEEMIGNVMELTHSVYKHEDMFGQYCSIQDYIDCPPEKVFSYLADTINLEEWTYSLRGFKPTQDQDVFVGKDNVSENTLIYCKTVANKDAMTVDYHCAWDQGKELWMIYLMRVIPATLVLNKPGSVVLWTNCHHPYYQNNPYPELASPPDRPWVGQYWNMFYAGHMIELTNLKKILEYRHKKALSAQKVSLVNAL